MGSLRRGAKGLRGDCKPATIQPPVRAAGALHGRSVQHVHACTHACMHACMHARTHWGCMPAPPPALHRPCMHARICARMHACMHPAASFARAKTGPATPELRHKTRSSSPARHPAPMRPTKTHSTAAADSTVPMEDIPKEVQHEEDTIEEFEETPPEPFEEFTSAEFDGIVAALGGDISDDAAPTAGEEEDGDDEDALMHEVDADGGKPSTLSKHKTDDPVERARLYATGTLQKNTRAVDFVRKGMPAEHLPGISATRWNYAAYEPAKPPIFKWDSDHVRMPCDPHEHERWAQIETALLRDFHSSKDLEDAILSYNARMRGHWSFHGLHLYCSQLSAAESKHLFRTLLPKIARLALQLPHLVTRPLPLLRQKQMMAVTLSQKQIAALLANAFFCTFPRRNSTRPGHEFEHFPSINFSALFLARMHTTAPHPVLVAKMQFVLNYFERVTSASAPDGKVQFRRQSTKRVEWAHCDEPLTAASLLSHGTIEDDGDGMLQVDFANAYLGGGVIGHGAVQEEIRFLVCPELIVSRLLCERLSDRESVVITGAERYSNYSGYSSSLKFEGDMKDKTPRSRSGFICTQIVAIDAERYVPFEKQLEARHLDRELRKAYCGFSPLDTPDSRRPPPVATGNWGCGAFKGDPYLKCLIQHMAASAARREMYYFTFGDEDLADWMNDFAARLLKKKWKVSDLYNAIASFRVHLDSNPSAKLCDFLDHLTGK
eukprot:m.10398 g.10398  ORF g.10398 m.10398 type:complete len:720 (-) comp3077_c0_seq2:78-2237(-)